MFFFGGEGGAVHSAYNFLPFLAFPQLIQIALWICSFLACGCSNFKCCLIKCEKKDTDYFSVLQLLTGLEYHIFNLAAHILQLKIHSFIENLVRVGLNLLFSVGSFTFMCNFLKLNYF